MIDNFNTENYVDLEKLKMYYNNCLGKLEALECDLWKYVTGEKQENGMYKPVFSVDAAQVLDDIQMYKEKLASIQKDASDFKIIMGNCKSLKLLADAKNRAENALANAERDSRNVLTRMMNNTKFSVQEIEKSNIAQEANSKRDNILAEIEPKLRDLKEQIQQANKILAKY
jgi:hypothetical protein